MDIVVGGCCVGKRVVSSGFDYRVRIFTHAIKRRLLPFTGRSNKGQSEREGSLKGMDVSKWDAGRVVFVFVFVFCLLSYGTVN